MFHLQWKNSFWCQVFLVPVITKMSDKNEQIVSGSTCYGRNWFSQHPVCRFCHWVAPQMFPSPMFLFGPVYTLLVCTTLSLFCTSCLLFQHNFQKLTSECVFVCVWRHVCMCICVWIYVYMHICGRLGFSDFSNYISKRL